MYYQKTKQIKKNIKLLKTYSKLQIIYKNVKETKDTILLQHVCLSKGNFLIRIAFMLKFD